MVFNSKDGKYSTERRFRFFMIFFDIAGFPLIAERCGLLQRAYNALVSLCAYSVVAASILDVYMHSDDVKRISTTLRLLLIFIMLMWIELNMRLRRDILRRLFLLTEYFTWEEMAVRDVHTGKLTIAGWLPCLNSIMKRWTFISLTVHILQSILRMLTSRDLSFQTWYPFNTSTSPAYEFIQITQKVVFSGESTFHVCWIVNRHNWGYIKDIVYKTVVADLEDLLRRIVAACATVTPEMLRNTWQELEYLLDICRATRGEIVSIPKVIALFRFSALSFALPHLYANLVCIACTQLHKIKDALSHFKQKDMKPQYTKGDDIATEEDEHRMQNEVKNIVRHHQQVLSYMRMMQDYMSAILGGILLFLMLLLCTAAFTAVLNIVRNGNIKIGDLSSEEVEKFKYLGATVTNINDTREEIKRRINMGNACYYSVEKLLSSSLLSKNLKVRIYKTVILPVLLYGCETWTLTLREEHRFRVFENKVLRKIFGAKRDEVTGEWRKLHNTELHALYSSPDIIRNIKSRRLRWAGHVARMGESRNAYRVLVGRPEGKRPLGRPRRRWEDNIKMDLREVGYDDRDWINLAQDRDRWRAYVRAAMNLRFDSVRHAAWNSDWVGTPPKYQYSMSFIILISNKGFELNAWNVVPVSNSTFMSVSILRSIE
ncbi:hypothetical protein ANN_17320 [Periplaneta americana]|uniref:Uncharacterized protein n=1 Tax=Periplaneta americana TaxID=6978 RepID=A0ABQ8SSM2_PERAM|nr:hypothetical protein ANN_17320 [Periplaneta americana]